MAFPAQPVPTYYSYVNQTARNGVYYQADVNTNAPPPSPNVTWTVGSVRIKA